METTATSPVATAKKRSSTKKEGEHYVNNKEFSQAVVDYVASVKLAEKNGTAVPRIP